MSETKLLPCPFCGREAFFRRIGTHRQSCQVSCTQCGTDHESADEGDDSGTAWNLRSLPWQSPPTWDAEKDGWSFDWPLPCILDYGENEGKCRFVLFRQDYDSGWPKVLSAVVRILPLTEKTS